MKDTGQTKRSRNQFQPEESRDILVKVRERQTLRKDALIAALKDSEASYETQLEALNQNASQVRETSVEVADEEILVELDARHMAIANELGLRNVETRKQALLELTDETITQVKEVQATNWPKPVIEDTITEYAKNQKRFCR